MNSYTRLATTTFVYLLSALLCNIEAVASDDFEDHHADLERHYSEGQYEEALADIQKLSDILNEKMQNETTVAKGQDSEEVKDLFKTVKSPLDVGKGRFTARVYFGDTTLYVIGRKRERTVIDDTSTSDNSLSLDTFRLETRVETDIKFYPRPQLAIEHQGKLAVLNKHIKVGDETRTIQFSSSNEEVLEVSNNGVITPKAAGVSLITVTLNGDTKQIPLRIVVIPVLEKMTGDEVISILGVPDETTEEWLNSGESERIDGIYYHVLPESEEIGINVIHWKYNKYPNVIVRFRSSTDLRDCVMEGWEKVETTAYQLEKGTYERLQEIDAKRERLLHEIDELKKRSKQREKLEDELYDLIANAREWTDNTGQHTVYGTFIDYKRGKVIIALETGGEIEVRASKLSREDRKWVTEEIKRRKEQK